MSKSTCPYFPQQDNQCTYAKEGKCVQGIKALDVICFSGHAMARFAVGQGVKLLKGDKIEKINQFDPT